MVQSVNRGSITLPNQDSVAGHGERAGKAASPAVKRLALAHENENGIANDPLF